VGCIAPTKPVATNITNPTIPSQNSAEQVYGVAPLLSVAS